MCMVSLITDHYGAGSPLNPSPVVPLNPRPAFPLIPPIKWPPAAPVTLPWDSEAVALLKEVLLMLKKLDARLGLPDCEDPNKAAWLKAIEAKLTHDQWGRKR